MKPQDDMLAFAREALGLSESIPLEVSPIEGRGSDRSFFRLGWRRKDSAILIHYDPKRVENTYYADIAAFLGEIDVPVPRLIRHDPDRCLIVMEDLGNSDLWSFRKTAWETRRALYQKTLSVVHRLHGFPEKDFPSSRVRLAESFGVDLYRWEQDYFREHFVRGVCGIELEPSFKNELEAELFNLAERLSGTRRSLVHRDLQSQNVMILGGKPFLIDFQGMRFGSPFYDLGSLLCDPYVDFSNKERDELLSYYYELWSPTGATLSKVEGSKWNLDQEAFQNIFWIASVQRLMQALGAYGFLGLKKGLSPYLEYIPTGLRNLQLAANHLASLPRLREVSQSCQKVLDDKG
jgi:aminoglycoside/choline kinase family phosphotransferase